jgi:hypothetical protein
MNFPPARLGGGAASAATAPSEHSAAKLEVCKNRRRSIIDFIPGFNF